MFQEIWSKFRGVKKDSDFLMSHNLRKRCKNNKLFFFSNQYIIAMDYEILEKMKVEELKNYFAREEKKETIKSFTKNEV